MEKVHHMKYRFKCIQDWNGKFQPKIEKRIIETFVEFKKLKCCEAVFTFPVKFSFIQWNFKGKFLKFSVKGVIFYLKYVIASLL